jgi:hypothetical protein
MAARHWTTRSPTLMEEHRVPTVAIASSTAATSDGFGRLDQRQDQQHVDHGIDRLPGGVTLEVGQRVRSHAVGAGGQDS